MDTIAISLNGTPVSGRPGMTILELAREVGIHIPTLCDDQFLKPVGACRICLVEEEKSGRLLASCVTPIAAGMTINTRSRAVIENRKIIVKLMLASHPESCLLCEKGNRCRLRKLAGDLGIGRLDYYPVPNFTGTQELNPFIMRDLSKCILCGKCIRADHELVVVGALDYLNRGFDSSPATLFDGPLETSECTFCGTCVSMCPTGALFERGKPHAGTIGARTATICSYCGCGCNIFLETVENRLISVSPNPANDINGKTLCVRGHYGHDYVHHPDRLRRPLIRKDGVLCEVGWDEALDFAAEGLKNAYSRYGSGAVSFLGSSKCSNEENYLFQKIARTIFGTNNIDTLGRLHSGTSLESIPFDAMTNSLQDIEDSDVILVIGSNPPTSHPVAGYRIKRAHLKGAKIIVVDPKRTGLAGFSAVWVPIRPGTDEILLNGILKGLLDSKSLDEKVKAEIAEELPEVIDSLAGFVPQLVEEFTGCSQPLLEAVVRLISEARSPAFVYGHGITRQINGTQAIRAIENLALLKAGPGESCGGIYPLDKESNTQGAWDMGTLPNLLPGYLPLDDPDAIRFFENAWKTSIPTKPGLSAAEAIRRARAGEVKAMYIMGENPLRSFLDPSEAEKGLSTLDFLVVQDLFLTETAQFAHVVFPACSFAEKDGTFTNIEGRVQRIRKAIEPVGQSLPDYEILCRIARRMGYPADYRSAGEIMDEISYLTPLYRDISYGKLEKGGIFRPCSRSISDGEKRLPVRRRAAKITPAEQGHLRVSHKRPEDGDFILLKGSTLYHFLGGTRSTRSARLLEMEQEGLLEMNPMDAGALGLRDGDMIKLHNDKNQVVTRIKLSESLPRGILFSPLFDRLTTFLAPLGVRATGTDVCRVRIEKEICNGPHEPPGEN